MKGGKVLLTAAESEQYKHAIEKLNDWRSLHLVPLDMLQQKIAEWENIGKKVFSWTCCSKKRV